MYRSPSGGECLKLAVEIHLPGKILKDGNGLDVEITEHSVALPASEETD